MITAKKIYNSKIGSLVAREAKSPKKDYFHIIYNYPNRWAVVREGKVRPIKVFRRIDSAIAFANKSVASRSSGKVIVHDSNGNIPSRSIKVNGYKH